jgi:hypothetical protein
MPGSLFFPPFFCSVEISRLAGVLVSANSWCVPFHFPSGISTRHCRISPEAAPGCLDYMEGHTSTVGVIANEDRI